MHFAVGDASAGRFMNDCRALPHVMQTVPHKITRVRTVTNHYWYLCYNASVGGRSVGLCLFSRLFMDSSRIIEIRAALSRCPDTSFFGVQAGKHGDVCQLENDRI
jgi:hypothetical protein